APSRSARGAADPGRSPSVPPGSIVLGPVRSYPADPVLMLHLTRSVRLGQRLVPVESRLESSQPGVLLDPGRSGHACRLGCLIDVREGTRVDRQRDPRTLHMFDITAYAYPRCIPTIWRRSATGTTNGYVP